MNKERHNKNILFLGEYSSGKTALINMILGFPVLPEKLSATDLPSVKVSKGDGNKIYYQKDGDVTELTDWLNLPNNWSLYDFAGISIKNHPLLNNNIVLWDTPGINSTDQKHLDHLTNLLNYKPVRFKLVYYIIPDKLTSTTIDFLKKWKSSFKNLIVLINIKDLKTYEESRAIEREIKQTLLKEVGAIQTHLLNIGDVCEEFNNIYSTQNHWDKITNWNPIIDKFRSIIESNISNTVGEDIFNSIQALSETDIIFPEDYSKLPNEKLIQLSNEEDSDAMYELGIRAKVNKNIDDSLKWFLKSAEYENDNSLNQLGLFYLNGIGVDKDEQKAFNYFLRASKQINSEAFTNLGLCYLNGIGVDKDLNKSKYYFEKGASFNNPIAQYHLAYHLIFEEKSSFSEAEILLQKTSKAGFLPAAVLYGKLLVAGEVIPKNIDLGLKFLEAAANKNDAESIVFLAEYFSKSINSKITDKQLNYIKQAAELNHLLSIEILANFYFENGENQKAVSLYKTLSDNGNLDASYKLAFEYYEGKYLERNIHECAYLMKELANKEYVPAMSFYGNLLLEGEGVQKDGFEAVRWFKKAADTFEPNALNQLGKMYEKGEFVEKERRKSFHYLKMAEVLGIKNNSFSENNYSDAELKDFYSSFLIEVSKKIDPNTLKEIDTLFTNYSSAIKQKESELRKRIENLTFDQCKTLIDFDKEFGFNNLQEKAEILLISFNNNLVKIYVNLNLEKTIKMINNLKMVLKKSWDLQVLNIIETNLINKIQENIFSLDDKSFINKSKIEILKEELKDHFKNNFVFNFTEFVGAKIDSNEILKKTRHDAKNLLRKIINDNTSEEKFFNSNIKKQIELDNDLEKFALKSFLVFSDNEKFLFHFSPFKIFLFIVMTFTLIAVFIINEWSWLSILVITFLIDLVYFIITYKIKMFVLSSRLNKFFTKKINEYSMNKITQIIKEDISKERENVNNYQY
ncbi:MAG: dynamin family protein [Melioribacteraceae bacterium]|nr:dynamin family protein [Melioribacteraceae bacterium]